jgi:hypothetical protein
MTLGFKPFLYAKLVLHGTKKARLFLSSFTTVVKDGKNLRVFQS